MLEMLELRYVSKLFLYRQSSQASQTNPSHAGVLYNGKLSSFLKAVRILQLFVSLH